MQALVGKSGKQALKRRVEEFDITKVTPAMTAKPREYMRDYTADDVRIVSSGAASFFVWVRNSLSRIIFRTDKKTAKATFLLMTMHCILRNNEILNFWQRILFNN